MVAQDAERALMDVTDVLRDRMHEPAGLQQMIAVSIAVHAALVGASLIVAPRRLFCSAHDAPRDGDDDLARRRRPARRTAA